MVSRYTKLRIRRRIRNQRKTIEKAGETAGTHFELNVLERWRNLQLVRRFVTGWLLLITLLIFGVFVQSRELAGYYLTEVPIDGGVYREGVVGDITNVNPIYATSAADRAGAQLLFNSLFSYNEENRLVGDLARSFSTNDDGTVYTVTLRDDVHWHDGHQLDAGDVVFTYETIQHPDTRSYLNQAWRDIKVQQKSKFSVTFSLPNPFTPFPHALTQGGIIPEHLLGDIDPSQLRGHSFNNAAPVGTGPFEIDELLVETSDVRVSGQLRLTANEDFFKGDVRLDSFVLSTFNDREVMVDRFLDGELSSIGGLTTDDRSRFTEDLNSTWYDLPLSNIVFIFFKMTDDTLASTELRKALSSAIDQEPVHDIVQNRFPLLHGPILPNQLGYTDEYEQPSFNVQKANKLLDEAGWRKREGEKNDGFRYKDGKRLQIKITTQNSDDFPNVAREVARQWTRIGVDSEVLVVSEAEIQQTNISPHNYQTLLFGLSFGADPDPFVYWHSSQSTVGGFNLSEIENAIIDEALESGRTRSDANLREAKYETFTKEWVDELPAYALYRPAYSYVQRKNVTGFTPATINSPEQRFINVENWRINTDRGVRPF